MYPIMYAKLDETAPNPEAEQKKTWLRGYVVINVSFITLAYCLIVYFNWSVTTNNPNLPETEAACKKDVYWTFLSCGFAHDRGLLITFIMAIIYFWFERIWFEFLLWQYLVVAYNAAGPSALHVMRVVFMNLQMVAILLVGAVSQTEDESVHHWLTRIAACAFGAHEIVWWVLGLRPHRDTRRRAWEASAVLSTVHIAVVLGVAGSMAFCFSASPPTCLGGARDQAWYEYVLFLTFALVPLLHICTLPKYTKEEAV